MNGTVKKKIEDRGFGFIAEDGGKNEYFFHTNDVSGTTFEDLKVGDAVTFEVVQGQKGPAAVKVEKAS